MGYPHHSIIDLVSYFIIIRKYQLVKRPIVHQDIKAMLQRKADLPETLNKISLPGDPLTFYSVIDWNNIYFNRRHAWN